MSPVALPYPAYTSLLFPHRTCFPVPSLSWQLSLSHALVCHCPSNIYLQLDLDFLCALRPMPCSCYSHHHPRIWPRLHKLFDQGLLFFLPHSNPCVQIWCLPSWSFFADFTSGLSDTTFRLTDQTPDSKYSPTPPPGLYSLIWVHTQPVVILLHVPRRPYNFKWSIFLFSHHPQSFLFSRSKRQHHQLICFLLPPLPLLISPPPLLSATRSSGHIFSLCYYVLSPPITTLELLSFGFSGTQIPPSG